MSFLSIYLYNSNAKFLYSLSHLTIPTHSILKYVGFVKTHHILYVKNKKEFLR